MAAAVNGPPSSATSLVRPKLPSLAALLLTIREFSLTRPAD